MLLCNANKNDVLIVASVLGDSNTVLRLKNLGIEKGVKIKVVRALKNNKAMIISLLSKAVILSYDAALLIGVSYA